MRFLASRLLPSLRRLFYDTLTSGNSTLNNARHDIQRLRALRQSPPAAAADRDEHRGRALIKVHFHAARPRSPSFSLFNILLGCTILCVSCVAKPRKKWGDVEVIKPRDAAASWQPLILATRFRAGGGESVPGSSSRPEYELLLQCGKELLIIIPCTLGRAVVSPEKQ